ncbi:Tti1p NDAI_0K01840 [Naumovozyma dairenensis CBS 421]|uniref:TEL2-interacting protein 1 n=1 Tax=Naumovozyma dairenensis (strain ATCC 10597 / BCRC 20456 / CBS 421 / NBRC 0211 / NRRL Y-12639) TaxID=1071378 RepID=G0WHW4_NAUDC|nr:hypothetical protein NDAI_0K01840 [Naumovozyma dairenensis CBS 421]CCD27375.1 hypothetical protein NDAI_0K01840 [Naumovozyma dairenensis CBS 421]
MVAMNTHVTNDSRSAFLQVKPICVALSQIAFLPKESFDPESKTLLETLKSLETVLSSFPDASLSLNFADYVFIPLSSLLKQNELGQSQTEYVLLIFCQLSRLCWLLRGTLSEKLAKQCFPLLTFLISPDKENLKLKEASSHFKISAVKTLYQFFKSLKNQSYSTTYFQIDKKDAQLPTLAHTISIFLDLLLDNPQSPNLLDSILNSLNILYFDIIKDGELLSFVLPGNVSTLSKVLNLPGKTVNYKIVCLTLKTLGSLLQLVYNDSVLGVQIISKIQDLSDITKTITDFDDNDIHSQLESIEMNSPGNHRNSNWLKATSQQVNLALKGFIPRLISRNNRQIDESLVSFVSSLMLDCSSSLKPCESIFIETLVSLQQNPLYQLATHSKELSKYVEDKLQNLNRFIQFDQSNEIKSLNFATNILVNNANEKISNISMITNDIIKQINDSLIATSNSDSRLLSNVNGKSKQKKVIEQSSNVIVNDLQSFQNSKDNTLGKHQLLPKISKEMEHEITNLLNRIGSNMESQDLQFLLNHLLSNQTKNSTSLSEKMITLWTATQLLNSHGSDHFSSLSITNEDNPEFLTFNDRDEQQLGPQYNEACFTILEYCNDLSEEISINLESSTHSMTQEEERALCIVLYSISNVSTLMGTDFAMELIDHLYIVIDNLANSSYLVRSFAQSCSINIANLLYDGSVKELILQNVDYLVESIAVRLNSGMMNHVGTILMVICKIAGFKTIRSFQDVIETIFKLLEYFHGYSDLCLEFFQLFEIIILEMKKEYLATNTDDRRLDHQVGNVNSFKPWGMKNIDQLIQVLETFEEGDQLTNPSPDDYPLDEDEPKNFQDYFDSKLREVDSDDESIMDEVQNVEGEGVLENDDGEEEEEDEKDDDEDKWVSPIPNDAYKILLQIFSYSDRLLTHPSKPLRIQILRTCQILIPMISTQHSLFLPQVAQFWNTVVKCSLDDDFNIIKYSMECIELLMHFADDFITKRFFEFWSRLKNESVLLKKINKIGNIEGMKSQALQKFPIIIRDALLAMSKMLLEGIKITEFSLPETIMVEMIEVCLNVLPVDEVASRSLVIGDIVWSMK